MRDAGSGYRCDCGAGNVDERRGGLDCRAERKADDRRKSTWCLARDLTDSEWLSIGTVEIR
jgi:hypothetical protein